MLRVLTLNIWNLNHWRDRRDEIVAWLSHIKPDIVGLQEVVRDESGRAQDRWLAERSGFEHVAFARGLEIGDSEFGNAILSRFPIVATDQRTLTSLEEPDEGRVVLRADLETPRGLLSVFTTHLNWQFHHGRIREAQVLEVADFVGARPQSESPPVLMGDFNAEPESTEIRFVKGLTSLDGRSFYMQDAFEVAGGDGRGHTWNNRNSYAAMSREPDRRIDYVFVGWRAPDGAGQIVDARVVCDTPLIANWPSDHMGLVADIRF